MIEKVMAVFLMICGVTVMGAAPLLAHHGTAMYDPQHPITLEGTVTEFEFVNPHARVHFEVKNKEGNAEQWVVECSAPAKLYRSGWNAKTLKPGDRITVSGFPRKDGAKEIAMTKLVPPNGPALGGDPEQ